MSEGTQVSRQNTRESQKTKTQHNNEEQEKKTKELKKVLAADIQKRTTTSPRQQKKYLIVFELDNKIILGNCLKVMSCCPLC